MAVISVNAFASPMTFQSSEARTSLLELYSSEGCSSCPPAESWLNDLKKSSDLWTKFVPINFHVDYWDYLGWRDPWGSKIFSDRQHAYAALWRSDTVYTPGFVLNGREWRGWFSARLIPEEPDAKVGILFAANSGSNQWMVRFEPSGETKGAFETHAALLANGLESQVKAGENRGRHLTHDFTVIRLVSKPLHREGTVWIGAFELPVPDNLPAMNGAVAFWITCQGQLDPLQTTGGWLGSSKK